jgi:Rieske 2Fe-2S family protein
MKDLTAIEALRRASAEGRPLPARAYTDEALFRLEKQRIFDGSTFAVAGLGDAERPGEWTRASDADPRLVITCGADLQRHAIFDVCRHRGATLLPEQPSGKQRALCIECPYHQWRYGLDGARLGAGRGSSEPLARARCERRAAQLWARHDDAVHPEFSLPEWLDALDRAPLVRARSTRWEVRANWKFVVQNFVEAHHFEGVHRALERWTPWRASQSTMGEWWIAGEMPLVEDAETVSETGRTNGRALIVGDERERRRVRDAYVFPNALYSRQPDYLLAYRLFALDVDRTALWCDTLVHSKSEGCSIDEVARFWDRVHDEDRLVCESQQRAAGSRGFVPVAYEPSEDGVRAFDAMIARALTETRE